MVIVACPVCGKKHSVQDSAVGKKGRCNGCGAVFVIAWPTAGSQSPPARAAAPSPPPAPPPPTRPAPPPAPAPPLPAERADPPQPTISHWPVDTGPGGYQPQAVPVGVSGFSKQRLAVVIAAGVGVLAPFLPWVTVPIVGGISGVSLPGGGAVAAWLALLLFGLTLGLCFVGNRQAPMRGGLRMGVIIPSILAGLVGLLILIGYQAQTAEDPVKEMLSVLVQPGFGIYLAILAGLAVPVLAFTVSAGWRTT